MQSSESGRFHSLNPNLNKLFFHLYCPVIPMYFTGFNYFFFEVVRVLTIGRHVLREKKKTLGQLVHIMKITETLMSRDYQIQDYNN